MVLENKKKICVKVTDSIVYACLDIDLGKVLFHYVMFCDKDLSSKSYRVSLRIAGLLYKFFALPSACLRKSSQDSFWNRGRRHKIANSEETAFGTAIFFGF